jgi:polyhydroxybutyrate depolymerase
MPKPMVAPGRLTPRLALLAALLAAACAEPPEVGETAYPAHAPAACAAGALVGQPGITNNEITPGGVKFNVRAPKNYNASVAHPLLIVFAPGDRNRFASETYVELTRAATAAGFVIAYSDNRTAGQPLGMSIPAIHSLREVPGAVGAKWCIDRSRVFLTGHSNGGSISTALTLLPETRGLASAIAPSAAGFTAKDLAEFSCPKPLSVMVMHSRSDRLFPGYGAEASKWWAACNRCDPEPAPAGDGCLAYRNCAGGVVTRYCEGDAGHATWPALNAAIIEFFRAAPRRADG